MCYFLPYIELVVTHTSVLTILAITVERYYAICLPLQVKNILLNMNHKGQAVTYAWIAMQYVLGLRQS